MREDPDFDGYLSARWPLLVRTLVLLGCPEELAADVALDGIARCRADWSRTRTTDDVDVVVHRSLLEAWEERRRTPWWQELVPPSAGEDEVRTEGLNGSLDRLSPDARAALVLRRYVGLDRAQSAAVLGPKALLEPPAEPTSEQLRAAVEDVGVLAPPAAELVIERDHDRQRRRRRQLVWTAAVVAVPSMLVVAGLAWLLLRSEPGADTLASVRVERAENPAEVAWYAEDRLHLEQVVLDIPAVRQFEPVAGGAAYGDEQGRVVFVAEDGSRRLLGHKQPTSPLAVSEKRDRVVWVEPDDAGPRLVVKELSSFGTVAVREIDPTEPRDAARPIAVVGDSVYFVDGRGAQAWTMTSGLSLAIGVDYLLDTNSRIRVFQQTPITIRVAPPYSREGFTLIGTGGSLSSDGDLVLTRDAREQASFGPVLIYDTATGADLSVGLGSDDVALAAQLGPDRTVTYIVARAEDRPENGDFLRSSFSGQLELRTCDIDARRCESLERLPSTGTRPLLAY